MKLSRLRVAELRQFREPFELANILPGLNIFTGANEAGKSTLVRAIRAAYFERHRSTSVDDLRPYGDSAATPLIELDFEIDGTPYRLTKSFLQKKRCELTVGTRRLEGVEAEDFMAERLGFQFALKGASREEHWGIPGLLWIEQGSAQVVRDAVVNASDHLRKALDESLGEVAASGGDDVVAQVRKLREELLTGTGKPKANYQKALDDASNLAEQVAALESAVANYRDQVDQLRRLRDAHEIDTREQPWASLRAQQANAQEALRAVEELTGQLDRERETLRQVSGLRDLLLQRLASAELQKQNLASREATLISVTDQYGLAAELERQCVLAETSSTGRMAHARTALLLARQEANRVALRRQLSDAQMRAADLRSLLERASAEHERLLIAPSTLSIAGVGLVHIAPGGSDLTELAQEQRALLDEHHALLQRLGLASTAEAEAREQSHAQRLADAAAAEKARKLLAPKGLDALRGDLDAADARRSEAEAALEQLPEQREDVVLPLDAAERDHEGCREAAEAAGQSLQAARHALATVTSQRDSARQERDSLKAAEANPALQAELATKRAELLEAGAKESALRSTIEGIEARIAAARLDILRQDVDRLRRSAEESERQHQARDRQIVQIKAALDAVGAQGLEEDLAKRQSERTLAVRRADELRRRADALDHLLGRLELRRQALTRRLQAPLQKHLDRYLQLLFPSGRLEVDEQLVPGALTRPGPRGAEAGSFETLSYGAREQMGVISRLAYADLLQEAGRPTLIILDDALVHSDDQRLVQMKRVLFDAAQRHQVLLFTCHPANWRDMGVPLRALDEARHGIAAT